MNKEFVSYEIALDLKNLGFDETCFGYYNMVNHSGKYVFDTMICENSDNYIEAPLFQQAFRFFREKYNLYDNISVVEKWSFKIEHIPFSYDKKSIHSENDYDTYKEAEIECLKQLIKIAKQKL